MARALGLANLLDHQVGGRRNLIINGGFDVWQRGTSFTSVPNQDYTADRWVVSAGTPNVNKGTLDTTYGNVLTITGTSTSGVYFSQRIESPEIYQEKTLTVSFYAKASSAVNINQKIRVKHTGGNYDRNTIADFDLTTSWQRFSYTFLVNDSGGALSFDSTSYIDVQIISNSNINGITVSFAQVQVEMGETATPFEHRSYGEELALCQRYYYYLDSLSTGGGSPSLMAIRYNLGQNIYAGVLSHPTYMRTGPTVNFENGMRIHLPGLAIDSGTLSAAASNEKSVVIALQPANYNNSNVISAYPDGDGTTTKKIFLDAEL